MLRVFAAFCIAYMNTAEGRQGPLSSITIGMEEEGAAGVRTRLQPPSMSIRSWGHDSATADSALERSLVLLCRLRICTSRGSITAQS